MLEKLKKQKVMVFFSIYFLAYFSLGLLIFDDFGVNWDEITNIKYGQYLVDVFENQIQGLSYNRETLDSWGVSQGGKHHINEHGPAIELPIGIILRILDLEDYRDIILFRHFITFFLFFTSSVFFCKLAFSISKDVYTTFLGVLIYTLHPRIFAHSFQNLTDISLLAFFTISLYSSLNFFLNPSKKNTLFHAFVTAYTINLRVVGFIIPATTIMIFFIRSFLTKEKKIQKNNLKKIFPYIFYSIILVVIMNPLIWQDWGHMSRSINDTLNNHASASPWDYNIRWYFFTTPIIITILFSIGFLSFLKKALKLRKLNSRKDLITFIAFIQLYFALALPIIVKTFLYDSWRHHFFMYSSISFFCFLGLESIKVKPPSRVPYLGLKMVALFVIFYSPTIWFMISQHPNQQVYGNDLNGGRMTPIRYGRSLDYWGMSYKQGIEYLLKTTDGPIHILNNHPVYVNSFIFPKKQRDRLIINDIRHNNNEYYITNFRAFPQNKWLQSNEHVEIHRLSYNDFPYLVIYKKTGR